MTRTLLVATCLLLAISAAVLAGDVDQVELNDFRDAGFQRQALAVARSALRGWVARGRAAVPSGRLHPALLRQAGVFVSLDLPGGVVRGCRGTLEPRSTRLVDEIVANVREAALRDPLHKPLGTGEVEKIRIVLCVPGHAEQSWDDEWDARLYGLLVESGGRAAVMLPWEAPDATRMRLWAMKRAGIPTTADVRMRRFPAVRFAEPGRPAARGE